MSSLDGRISLVTGAGRGIGAAIAKSLAAAGSEVVLAARTVDQLEAVRDEIVSAGGRARAEVLDVVDARACGDLVSRIIAESGSLDILVNNAGIAESAPLKSMTDEHWDRTMAVNVRGPFVLSRLSSRAMRERGWGRIVNIASTAGRVGYAYMTAYCASKHALIGMTRAFSKECIADGVTVNAVCPGYVETDITSGAIENIARVTSLSEEEARKQLEADSPMGRMATPEEVAFAVMAFLGEGSGAMSGQALGVCGGAVEG